MSKNTTIGIIIGIVVVLVGVAVYYQSRQDAAEPVVTETTTNSSVTSTPRANSTIIGTVSVAPTSTSSAAVSVGTPGYTDYTMKAGESINIAGHTVTLTAIGTTDTNVKLVKGPTTSNRTYKLNIPNTGYGFTGEIRSINTTTKSVVFRITILP